MLLDMSKEKGISAIAFQGTDRGDAEEGVGRGGCLVCQNIREG
jgi:hypothetical protein